MYKVQLKPIVISFRADFWLISSIFFFYGNNVLSDSFSANAETPDVIEPDTRCSRLPTVIGMSSGGGTFDLRCTTFDQALMQDVLILDLKWG